LTTELKEAKKKEAETSLSADKKTFLKIQIPKLEKEVASTKDKVLILLESEELDPRGEWFVLAHKLTKAKK
jgi:hypothetical protein